MIVDVDGAITSMVSSSQLRLVRCEFDPVSPEIRCVEPCSRRSSPRG